MRKLYQKIKNMKYRNKLRALLVIASLVPVLLIGSLQSYAYEQFCASERNGRYGISFGADQGKY